MLSCKHIAEKASDYTDNSLGFFSKLEVLIHCAVCKDCKHFLKYFTRLYRRTPQFDAPQASEEEVQKVMAHIRSHSKQHLELSQKKLHAK